MLPLPLQREPRLVKATCPIACAPCASANVVNKYIKKKKKKTKKKKNLDRISFAFIYFLVLSIFQQPISM